MPTTTENAASTAQAATCTCLGCGDDFTPSAKPRGVLGHMFCTDKCRQCYHNRNKAEGGPMVAMVKAWHLTRHAKPGTVEAEICKFARGQLTQMAGHWIERDRDEGRDQSVEYVRRLMESGTLWIDRVRG